MVRAKAAKLKKIKRYVMIGAASSVGGVLIGEISSGIIFISYNVC